ncbi:hypothetical protein EV421DRAFT_2040157 [Armillaria borealis]|uniref:Uncharacterized protein n=1 Tax=Armillaria borealis TaxID=47425 RepID=A0AA39MH59_9AGAR|nr:hypothetical protein EV421DRAFT_2040157 [Armillaria borealis]
MAICTVLPTVPTIEMMRAIDLAKQRLPNLRRIDVPGEYRLDDDSTTATKLPKVFETFSDDLKSCYESPLLQRVLAELLLAPMMVDGSHLLVGEGDVRVASALYLIHQVNLIIEKVLDAKGLGAGSLKCRSPPDRPDLVWQFSSDRDLLQLKYKNTKILRATDWDPIVTNTGPDSKRKLVNQQEVSTLLEHNAVPIARQATKYGCSTSSSGVVAVFDYDGVVILDFKPGGEGYDDIDNTVKYLFCGSDDVNWTFRQLLLAVIIYSFRKEGVLGTHE